jgi:alpha-beta hydrolase superfamily lysophospholipase
MPSTTSRTRARDGTELLVRHWAPAGDAWATVVLVHGIAEHSGRYEHVGDWLAAAGLEVAGFDLRGFGGSGGRRAVVERWRGRHDDLAERIAAARADAAGRPVVVWGHSLGGLIALGYCVSEVTPDLPDALVLSAPALDSATPRWQRVLAGILTRVAPTILVKNAFDGSALSRDPRVAEAYVADPLNQHSTTTRFGAEALAEGARVRAALDRLSIPTYVLHGEADRLVPPNASEPLGRLPGVTRRTWPGLRHESHNEPEGQAVVAAAVAWLRSVLQSTDN